MLHIISFGSEDKMKIVVVNREKIEKIPPLISVVKILSDLGHQVTLITTGITEKNKSDFIDSGVDVRVIPYEVTKSISQKVKYVRNYRKLLSQYLSEISFDYVWLEGPGAFRTAIGIVNKYKFVMQISELYDYPEAKPIKRAIDKLIYKASVVVMPEINRATLYQVEYGLKERPFVLPNKPYFYLEDKQISICEEKYKEELKIFKQKKVILYQGIIAKERDLSNYIKAVKNLGEEYAFVLLGADFGMIENYKKINPDIIHIDFIPAPDYLIFTMNACVGMISYDGSTLNCAYCAPNKIYEYGKYGLPMIGNDIPGLRNTIGYYDAGVIVDENSEESILNGIRLIEENYEMYRNNALKLYENTDNVKCIEKIIDCLE